MISGVYANNGNFLADLSELENRISQVNKQISSGIRVNQASDDPSAVAPILAYQGQLSEIKQVQSNLNSALTEAQTADGALQTASNLMDQLVSIGAQGASSTASASARAVLGEQVQNIEQQLVAVANTSIGGTYIFGGDSSSTAPYTFLWTNPEGVVASGTPANTATLRDTDGNEIVPRLTAQQIFDVQNPPGTPAPGNIFQAVFALGTALLANDQPGIQSALDQVKAGSAQLQQSTTAYGNIENWIQQGSQTATTHLNNITQALSAVRDSDVAADATQLSLDQTALQAALAAHAGLGTKSLFNFLG
jgi:flagellar hook-associated protein 3 FlgL